MEKLRIILLNKAGDKR